MSLLNDFNSNSAKFRAKRSLQNKIKKQNQHNTGFKPIKQSKEKPQPRVPKQKPRQATRHYNSSIKPLDVYDSEYKSTRITLLQLARINAIQNIKGISSRSKTIKLLLDKYIGANYSDAERHIMRTFEKGFIKRHE